MRRLFYQWHCEFNLSALTSPAFVFLDAVDSTNEEAKRRVQSGQNEACWIIADRQTAGRGRRGRVWESPIGNLMVSLLLPGPFKADTAAQLSFVSGLALLHLVKESVNKETKPKVSLKWPNDVLVDGRKISGILLEAASIEDGEIRELVIGMGVNLIHHPSDTPYPATHIGEWTMTPPNNISAAQILAEQFSYFYGQWFSNGFSEIRKAWLEHAKGLGEPIEVHLETETLSGVFQGLDSRGQLALRLDDGQVQNIAAGDVYFPNVDGKQSS